MFKKLKQKIEQEGSPGKEVPKDSTQTTDLSKDDENCQNVGATKHDTRATTNSVDSHKQTLDCNHSSKATDSEHSEPDCVAAHQENTSVAQENFLSDRDHSTITTCQDSSNKIPAFNHDSGDTSLPVSDFEPTPRRKNLAATVLRYGEEISAKNKQIVELETKLLQKGGCDDVRVRELEDSLHTSERSVRLLKTELSEQEETIKQLVLSLSKLEEVEAADKSVIVDLECKLSRHREETSHLTNQLQAYKIREASLEGTITSLQAKVGQLKVELQQSKLSSSSDSLAENGESEVQVSELKVKLGRAHSHSKQLELQLCDKDTQLSALVRENKDIKSSLENSKQQALDDLLSVSQEESGLRSELSALVQKHNSLQTQYKTQSRLLAEKQKDMIQLEETLQKHSRVNEKERVQLVENHTRQVTELERVNETLKLSLANETQSAAKIREQLDNMREEALDKQLDDEKQLSDLHEQLSALRGEIRQLERNKKKEVERLTSELSAKDSCLSRLEDSLSAAKSEHQSSQHSLSTQVVELESQLMSLRARNEELNKLLAENEQKLEMTDTESGELCLRNADLSSKLETCKMELKSALSSHEQDKASFQQKFASNEEMERSSSERFEALQRKISLLEEQVHVADGVRADVVQKSAQIDALSERLAEQEKTIADKTKSIRIQQQTINDLKKTIKRELKGMGDAGAQAGKSQDLIDRVRSSPALTDLDRYESPVEDNIPLPARHSTQTTAEPTAGSNSTALAQQYRHEVNGFCGHKDINFEYLKNVVFSFLISRDSESVHLVKALAVLLEFTPAEEKLLKETVEWKMSWWPTTKKPIKKVRK